MATESKGDVDLITFRITIKSEGAAVEKMDVEYVVVDRLFKSSLFSHRRFLSLSWRMQINR
jgi:hypothetical protein